MEKRLQKILDEVNAGTRKKLYDLKLSLDDLLTKDNEGKYFIEHILKYDVLLYGINNIYKSPEIAYIFCKNKKGLYGFNLDEESLFSIVNGERLIDYLIKNNALSYNLLSNIKEHTEIIDLLLAANKKFDLMSVNSDLIEKLMISDENGKYLIEKYINNDEVLSFIIPKVNDLNKLIKISNKFNNYELMKYANEDILMSNYNNTSVLSYLINEKHIIPKKLEIIPPNQEFIKFLMKNNLYSYLLNTSETVKLLEIEDNKTLLEILIDKGYKFRVISAYHEETISILYKHNMLNQMGIIAENILLTQIKTIFNDNSLADITLLEYMINNNYSFELGYIKDITVVKILYQYKRYDLLAKCDVDCLLDVVENDKTYFDYLLENIKNKQIKSGILENYSKKIDEQVKYYLIIAKHDMMEYAKELTDKMLLKKYNGITLLEGLLNADTELTLNNILTEKVKANPKIAVILKSRGLEQKNVDISSEKEHYNKDYLDTHNNKLGIGPLYEEGEILLNKLYQLFASDGKSDIDLISALVSGYRQSLFINYEVNLEELKRLIEIKEENKDKFYYIKKEDSGYFSLLDGSVFCDSPVVGTLLHETGHALHFYLVGNKTHNNYRDITKRARQNTELLGKVTDYANKSYEIKKQIKRVVETKYNDFFEKHYTEEKKTRIREILAKTIEEKREEYKELGISEEELNRIFTNTFTEEEYIAHQKRIFIEENVDAIIRSEYGSFMAIGDILDAIYEGNLHSGKQKNESGEEIKKTYGHGLNYYYGTFHGFDEMIANFAAISKAIDSQKNLELLKSIVGDEVYNMISEFYYKNIVYNNIETRKVGRI